MALGADVPTTFCTGGAVPPLNLCDDLIIVAGTHMPSQVACSSSNVRLLVSLSWVSLY